MPEPAAALPRRLPFDEHGLIHALEEPTVDRASLAFRYVSGAWSPEDDLVDEEWAEDDA